jgi:CheY-like chemotaxis protein
MKRSVLVVEDDHDLREIIAEVLRQAGVRVGEAVNGASALDLLKRSEELPGVILLDLMMPVMDGWQFRAEQQRDPRLAGIPVIVMSAVTDGEAKAAQLRPAAYLKKPMDLDEVIDVVRRHCGTR